MAQSKEEDAMAAAAAAASHFEALRRFVDGKCLNGGLPLSHAVRESPHVAPAEVGRLLIGPILYALQTKLNSSPAARFTL